MHGCTRTYTMDVSRLSTETLLACEESAHFLGRQYWRKLIYFLTKYGQSRPTVCATWTDPSKYCTSSAIFDAVCASDLVLALSNFVVLRRTLLVWKSKTTLSTVESVVLYFQKKRSPDIIFFFCFDESSSTSAQRQVYIHEKAAGCCIKNG